MSVALALAAAVLYGLPVHAQVAARASEPPAGARVRVSTLDGSLKNRIARLSAIDDDRITFVPKGSKDQVVIERPKLQRLQWSLKRSKKGLGALIGLGTGLGAGVVWAVAENDPNSEEDTDWVIVLVFLTPILGAMGAGAGALIAPGEDWADVMPPVVPSHSSSDSGLRVGRFRLHTASIDRPETLGVAGRPRGFSFGISLR